MESSSGTSSATEYLLVSDLRQAAEERFRHAQQNLERALVVLDNAHDLHNID